MCAYTYLLLEYLYKDFCHMGVKEFISVVNLVFLFLFLCLLLLLPLLLQV